MLSFEDEASVLYPFPPDEHPVTLYARGDPETRRNVILHHPEVNGFIFLHEGVISKGHFTKKITDFRCPPVPNRNIIAAVSGTPDEFTPFSVIESEFFTDALHFTNKDDEDQFFDTVSVFKFIKDNRKKIEIPNMFSTDTKAKHARLKAVPIILPTVRGVKVEEGPLDSEDVTLSLQANAIYDAWAALLRSDHIASELFLQNKCPRPRNDMEYATSGSLPLKVLFKSSHILHNPYIKRGISPEQMPSPTQRHGVRHIWLTPLESPLQIVAYPSQSIHLYEKGSGRLYPKKRYPETGLFQTIDPKNGRD